MEKLRVREFKKLAFDKFTTSKCQIWAAALGSLIINYLIIKISPSLSRDLTNTSLLTEENSFRIERKAISSVCSFILISCWHDLKTENSLPMSSNLLSPWLCVLVCTASLVWLFVLTLHSSPLESSLGSSPISLPAPPLRRSSFSPYIVLVCVLSKQPAFIPVIASVIWLNCLSFLIEGTVLHFRNLNVQQCLACGEYAKTVEWMFDSSVLKLVQNTLEATSHHFDSGAYGGQCTFWFSRVSGE